MENVVKKEGYSFSFNQNACSTCKGKCCIGESGYIWLNKNEIEVISKFLGITKEEFKKDYLYKIGYKYSINEVPYEDGFRCTFFDTKKLQCSIYNVRPNQCRTFPFWEHFKTNIKEVRQECPGICNL